MIGFDTVFSALVVVTLLLILLSVPSILVTLYHSSRQFSKYGKLRLMKERPIADIPPKMAHEWNAVRTDVGYLTVISEELEKIGALRPALFNSEVSIILIVVLMFVPGFEPGVFAFMSCLLVICFLSLVLAFRTMKRYGEEYVAISRNMSEKNGDSKDNMYV